MSYLVLLSQTAVYEQACELPDTRTKAITERRPCMDTVQNERE